MGNLITRWGFYSVYNIDTKLRRVKSITKTPISTEINNNNFKNQLKIWRLCNNILRFQESDSPYLNYIHVTHTTQ
ncbi:hypothetical protein PAHAL_1G249500 [Panicum hallii]|uniref:Uncharacterized protein n=1 Tax=Panicum hallii TaxID=206008 RepID=A0A2T8KWE2_9POAL|nr:hypothetical protein PAHAL_1G249500 [Panicum hallii]